MSLDIKLRRADKIYRPGDKIVGVVQVTSKGSSSHNGITLELDGTVNLQLSAKSVGLFEAFYNALKPVQMIHYNIEVAPAGKLPDGLTEIPFEFPLEPAAGQLLSETYHGVFVNIQYNLKCNMTRSLLAKNVEKLVEFLVEMAPTPKDKRPKDTAVAFSITPESLDNIKKKDIQKIPKFTINGSLVSATCHLQEALKGELIVEQADATIKSIEIQLVRVETCGCADGYAKEATEIQNLQVADGNICRNIKIPIFMVFPRLFTCPTLATRNFKIEFECNLVVLLQDGHLITENFPIKLYR